MSFRNSVQSFKEDSGKLFSEVEAANFKTYVISKLQKFAKAGEQIFAAVLIEILAVIFKRRVVANVIYEIL
jgi:hypothetical protein